MITVNEKSTLVVTGTFTDEAGSPVTPSGGTYQVNDWATGTIIKASTPFTPASPAYDFVISGTENAMVNAANSREIHVLTVIYQYSGGRQGTEEYRFWVKNLMGVV